MASIVVHIKHIKLQGSIIISIAKSSTLHSKRFPNRVEIVLDNLAAEHYGIVIVFVGLADFKERITFPKKVFVVKFLTFKLHVD